MERKLYSCIFYLLVAIAILGMLTYISTTPSTVDRSGQLSNLAISLNAKRELHSTTENSALKAALAADIEKDIDLYIEYSKMPVVQVSAPIEFTIVLGSATALAILVQHFLLVMVLSKRLTRTMGASFRHKYMYPILGCLGCGIPCLILYIVLRLCGVFPENVVGK